MANNIFKLAKAYVRKHPRTSFQDAIQKVKGKARKKVGAVKKKKNPNRQTGSSNKSYDSRIKARRPGARVPAGGRTVTYTERRKNRSDAPGSLTGVSAAKLVSILKDRLKDKLGKQLVSKELAGRKIDKRRWQKVITDTRSRLKKLL